MNSLGNFIIDIVTGNASPDCCQFRYFSIDMLKNGYI